MNTEQIQKAVDILTKLLNEPKAEVRTTLSVTLTARELEVLRDICALTDAVPNAVTNFFPGTSRREVYDLLHKLEAEVYSAK